MPRKLREFDCADCGARTRRPRLSNQPWICAACGRRRISAAQHRRWGTPIPYDAARDTEVPTREE